MVLFFVGMFLLKALVVAALAVGIYKLVIFLNRKDEERRGGIESGAVNIVKKRFASGEIDEEEYRTKIRALRS
jgi:uncharacterized membrane protein